MKINIKKSFSLNYFVYFVYAIFLFGIFSVTSISAKDIGVVGKIYQISECDFLDFIKSKLLQMEKDGKLEELNKKMIKNTQYRADRPTPVEGITKAFESKSWTFDPTYIVPRDIVTSNGLVAQAGSKVNPLDTITLSKELIFYDADDKEQVIWAQNEDKKINGRDKLILINGSISSQTKLFNKPIYFDQAGSLTTRFNIKHVPAMVKQNGKILKITEVKI